MQKFNPNNNKYSKASIYSKYVRKIKKPKPCCVSQSARVISRKPTYMYM